MVLTCWQINSYICALYISKKHDKTHHLSILYIRV